jgi:tRNA nucleotidyltransferase/poly(A) polymerase
MQAGLTTTLRCAGGWVRDKLMGRQSLDIDIALDNMLGKEFADEVNKYLKSHVRTSAFCQSGFSMNRLY